MFTKDIGIDLGTANTLVYMKGRGIIMREPSVVAVDPRSDELRVRSVGHEAKAVIGRAPGSIVAVRPLKDGVIADFDVTAAMLQSFIRQACGNSILARPRVVICVPSGVTEVERRAVRQAAAKAGARQVTVIEEPMAAAIGSGLPTTDAVGSMIVDIGGGTAEVAVISLSGIVASRSVRCAGDALDQSIIAFIKRKYNLLVGERTAEQIKIEIGSACPQDPETSMEIKGRTACCASSRPSRTRWNAPRPSCPATSLTAASCFPAAVRCFAGWIPSSRMRRASRSTLPKAPWTV